MSKEPRDSNPFATAKGLGQNPFGSPTADLGGRIPYDGDQAEAEQLRALYLGRETTLRALGIAKLATVAACAMAAVMLLWAGNAASVDSIFEAWDLHPGWSDQATGIAAAAVCLLGLPHLVIAAGLWYLQPWGRWMQAFSSLLMEAVALMVLVLSLGGGSGLAVLYVFCGMLIGAAHTIVLYLVLSHPAGQITKEEHADIRRMTPAMLVKRVIGIKVCLLLLIWIAGFLGVAGSFWDGRG